MVGVSADVDEGGGVAVVEVDASDLAAIVSCDTLDVDISLALVRALFRFKKRGKGGATLVGL